MHGARTPTPANLPDLPDVLAPLGPHLDAVGRKYREILAGVSVRSRDMVEQAAHFNGKRLRPGLTCVAARMAGGQVDDDVATVAAIVELIHTATLVHDDVLDAAQVRRRVATLNTRWGNHTAVLAGDVLFSKAYRAAAYMDDRYASCYLSDVVGEILEGEIYQDLLSRNADLTEQQYRRIIRGKTAALYEASLHVGAHYGGGGEELKAALGGFGHHLGMAFQIVDDRLDLTGDEATVGKSLGKDLSEGKTTLPVVLWLRSMKGPERLAAHALVEQSWDDPVAACELARRLNDDDALARADEAARAEIDLGLACIEPLSHREDHPILEAIAGFVLSRTL